MSWVIMSTVVAGLAGAVGAVPPGNPRTPAQIERLLAAR